MSNETKQTAVEQIKKHLELPHSETIISNNTLQTKPFDNQKLEIMSNNKQHTTVDWLKNWMSQNQYFIMGYELLQAFEQAKQMEKEQMIEFAQEVFRNRYNQIHQSLGNIADDIYNETYGGNK